jgi:hypothetical protein
MPTPPRLSVRRWWGKGVRTELANEGLMNPSFAPRLLRLMDDDVATENDTFS